MDRGCSGCFPRGPGVDPPKHGIVLEVEAGRGAANNADYRDLVRTSLMVDSKFLVPLEGILLIGY